MPPEPPAERRTPPRPDRRRFLLAGATVAAAGLGAGAGLLSGGGREHDRGHPAARPGTMAARSRFMQVVAHEDDDLLFMTPDLWHTLRAGSPHLTVYLSAGESKAGIPPDTHDAFAYVAERQSGLRSAYAMILGVPDRWRARTIEVGPLRLQSYALRARPDVRMVFLLLPDGRDPRANLGWHTLGRLWSDPSRGWCGWTQARTGSPFRQCLSREDVLAVLVHLMEGFAPTVVRAQDPDPDRRYSADHPDHVAAARFAAEAVRRYTERHPDRFVLQVNHRDYNIRNLAVNLSEADRRFKQRVFSAYARHDYRISYENPHWDAYEARMAYRWPRGTGFVTDDAVYAVAAGRPAVWRRAGGRWEGPRSLGDPGGPLAPAVVAAGPLVLGLRTDTGEIVAYDAAGWRSLGRPDPHRVGNPAGTPVAATDGSGVLAVFVRNGRGGVSARYLNGRGFHGGWADLPGVDPRQVVPPDRRPGHGGHAAARRYGDVQDGLATVVTDDGRIELFAATRSRLLWWRQPEPGAPLIFAGPLPAGVPIAPLAAEQSGGQVRVLFREAWTGRVLGISRPVSADTWGTPAPVPGAGGPDGEAPVPGALPRFDGPMVGAAASLPDGTAVCALGADGRLHVASRTGRAYAAWRPIGD